jgi:hypothetical protein
MTLLRRRTKPLSLHALQAKADASKALAVADAAALKFQTEAEAAMALVSKQADILQQRISDADTYDAERTAISARLEVAQRSAWALNDMLTNARTAVDASIGDAAKMAEHGAAAVALNATLVRAQQVVEQEQQAYANVPQSDLAPEERSQLGELRSIAKSPKRAWQYAVPPMRVDPNEELRRLGAYVREHPTPFKSTPRPMVDAR